jgi:hypothetical protein
VREFWASLSPFTQFWVTHWLLCACVWGRVRRSGSRAAVTVSASGNGSLVSLAGTDLLPAVCQLDWICPPGHACDSVAMVKVRPYNPNLRLIPLTSWVHRVSQSTKHVGLGVGSATAQRVDGGPVLPLLRHQIQCYMGTFGANGRCLDCPMGRFSSTTGATACTACPSSAPYSLAGAYSRSMCDMICDDGCDSMDIGAPMVGTVCPAGFACSASTGFMVRGCGAPLCNA